MSWLRSSRATADDQGAGGAHQLSERGTAQALRPLHRGLGRGTARRVLPAGSDRAASGDGRPRAARNRIGWAVQLGTIRYLGTFLENPEEVPAVVVAYVAEQLGLEPEAFAGYGSGEARWDHQEQIRERYGYTKFEFDQWFAFARWLYQRAWIGNERPTLGSTWPPSAWWTRRWCCPG
ncbi:DUF4158 domain-containing protein [Streptomyces sp. NPDC005970]|uniref:DUF4158 domain-containing protein n=1 Tax=Streptomyces sp. NPDC005970 TaxID=3156723 RepID=UPI0033C2D653